MVWGLLGAFAVRPLTPAQATRARAISIMLLPAAQTLTLSTSPARDSGVASDGGLQEVFAVREVSSSLSFSF